MAKTVKGEKSVIIPGDPERELESERMENGISLLQPVIEDLESLSQRFSIPLRMM
jgi:LDH2 family malate/lactate/ureidoglycolate dehydrogenase